MGYKNITRACLLHPDCEGAHVPCDPPLASFHPKPLSLVPLTSPLHPAHLLDGTKSQRCSQTGCHRAWAASSASFKDQETAKVRGQEDDLINSWKYDTTRPAVTSVLTTSAMCDGFLRHKRIRAAKN